MAQHCLSKTLFLGCVFVAFTQLASAEVMQCVSPAGTVTYTNVSCPLNAEVASNGKVSSTDSPSVTSAKYGQATSVKTASNSRRKSLAIDIETLKAAREAMLLMDQESSLLREQKLAALDEKNRGWLNFQW